MKPIDKIFESDNQNLEIQALKKAMKDAKDKRMYLLYKVIHHAILLEPFLNENSDRLQLKFLPTYVQK